MIIKELQGRPHSFETKSGTVVLLAYEEKAVKEVTEEMKREDSLGWILLYEEPQKKVKKEQVEKENVNE